MPSSNPDELVSLDTLCDLGAFTIATTPGPEPVSSFGISSTSEAVMNLFTPFLNVTVFHLMNWFYTGSQIKSVDELNRLVNEVLLAPNFDVTHLDRSCASTKLARLYAHKENKNDNGKSSLSKGGWRSQ